MPILEHNRLVFGFPQIEKEARFSIDFQRTLRIPDSDETYPLPPGLGSFPLRHAEDHKDKLPAQTTSRGGVILPVWQAEAMWLNFSNEGPGRDLDFPVAIKVAAGKINAVTGEAWRTGLHRDPQDYMVSPEQPWLDGFAIEKGVIRQFVAMPLGDGYSVEEQVTGEAEWGGIHRFDSPVSCHPARHKKPSRGPTFPGSNKPPPFADRRQLRHWPLRRLDPRQSDWREESWTLRNHQEIGFKSLFQLLSAATFALVSAVRLAGRGSSDRD